MVPHTQNQLRSLPDERISSMPHLLLRVFSLTSIFSTLCGTTSLRADDVPKGEVKQYTFEQSKIFPGTFRDYWIYVPKQYDPAKPACVYVNQDGVQFNAPAVFDKLIHEK